MFVTLCSHVLVAVKLVYIYSCIDTELINENSFHQNQFLIWYQSDFLDASNFLMVSQINFGNSLFFSFTIIIFFNFFSSFCHSLQAFLIHHCFVLQASQAFPMAETTATNASAANASTTQASSSSQDSYNLRDPLFLHPGENPGAVLTSQPLIGGENYPA